MVSIRYPLSRLCLPAALAVGLALLPALAGAEPKPPIEEESADVIFSKSFVGKTYADDLEVEGWDEVDGGLVAPPIYVPRYLREDGTYLVLTSREGSTATAATPPSFLMGVALGV